MGVLPFCRLAVTWYAKGPAQGARRGVASIGMLTRLNRLTVTIQRALPRSLDSIASFMFFSAAVLITLHAKAYWVRKTLPSWCLQIYVCL